MAVSIRLRREGAKNRPYFKVVVADSRSPRDGKFIEIIGTYDPKKPGDNSTLKLERAEYWMARALAKTMKQQQKTATGCSGYNRRQPPTGTAARDGGSYNA
jgi:small subunit ribosomal protein S16